MYEKKISVATPGLICFLLDDSGSARDCFPGTTDPVFKWIERYSGIILKELLTRCTQVQGDQVIVKPRYHTSITLYGSKTQLWGDPITDIESTVGKYTGAENSIGLGGNLEGTDAKSAFEKVYDILKDAIEQDKFKDSFPPMVFHLTDGESQTDATPFAEKIKQLATADGNVLIVNAYIGTQTNLEYKVPEDFTGYATEQEAGPSEDNIRLFNMSSEIPETICQNLVNDGIFPNLRSGCRLFFDVRTKEMLKHVIQVVGSIGSRADRTQK